VVLFVRFGAQTLQPVIQHAIQRLVVKRIDLFANHALVVQKTVKTFYQLDAGVGILMQLTRNRGAPFARNGLSQCL